VRHGNPHAMATLGGPHVPDYEKILMSCKCLAKELTRKRGDIKIEVVILRKGVGIMKDPNGGDGIEIP
jgi:hypothetical protein